MRPLLFLLALLLVAPSAAPAANGAPVKYWIFLVDKYDVAGKTALVPVSENAVERRLRRASRQDVGDLDRAVSPGYLIRLAELGIEPVVTSRWLNAVSAWLEDSDVERVLALPFVRSVSPVGIVRPLGMPIPPFESAGSARPSEATFASEQPLRFDYGSSLTQMTIAGAVAPVEAGLNGAGVRLGIIDTGWGPLTHPAIKPIKDTGRLVGDKNFTGFGDDGNRHALAVLSMAAGFDPGFLIGPAYGATILHARTEYAPTETNQEEDNFVAGLEWMESQGVDVVNVSLGYSTFDPGQKNYTYADMDGDTAITTKAADLAVSLGVVMVNAAGNEGCPSPTMCWFYVTSPADGDSVLTVGSVNSLRQKSGFSSFGPTSDGRIKPDVAAMGQSTTVAVESAGNNGYTIFGNGTSFASPMVAGVVALLLQANADLTPMEVHAALKSTASKANAPDNELGWGIINAAAALSLVTSREESVQPSNLMISAWPNPFADAFDVSATLPTDASTARFEVFDSIGRLLATYRAPDHAGPSWRFRIDGRDFPNGMLHFRLTTGDRRVTGSIVRSN